MSQTSLRTLKIVGLLWLVFFLVVGGSGFYLAGRVHQTEAERFPNLAQPCWSEDESQVAYLSRPSGDGPAAPWELWRVGAVDRNPQMVCRLDPGEWELLGWLDEDKRLLVQPRQQTVPSVTVVEVGGGKRQEIRFENKGIRLVGIRGGSLFFERLDEAEDHARSVALLTWTPGDNQLTRVTSVPFETETIRIDAACPSPNHKYLALVLLMGDSGRDRTLWFYDVEQDKLNWSGLRLNSLGIRCAWAPDSAGLVAAVQTDQNCDLYDFSNLESGEYTRLSSGSESHAYQPYWPRGSSGDKHFLLVEKKRVYKFDKEMLQATQLTAEDWDPPKTRDLSVSPRGNYATFVGLEADDDQLYRVGFKNRSTEPLLPLHPKTVLQKEWWFVLGQGFRTAVSGWAGG